MNHVQKPERTVIKTNFILPFLFDTLLPIASKEIFSRLRAVIASCYSLFSDIA